MAGSRSGYGLTDTVAATAAVRADIPGTPGESDGFRLICCTCETESITGPELGQTPFGFCLPKPGNRPTGKNSVVWDSPSLGWWEETQLKNWLRLRRWGPPCEDHIEEREDRAHRVAFLRKDCRRRQKPIELWFCFAARLSHGRCLRLSTLRHFDSEWNVRSREWNPRAIPIERHAVLILYRSLLDNAPPNYLVGCIIHKRKIF